MGVGFNTDPEPSFYLNAQWIRPVSQYVRDPDPFSDPGLAVTFKVEFFIKSLLRV
jgi:hypothetical protein